MSLSPMRICPSVGLLEPRDHPQRRRLAAAGRAEQGEERALPGWSGRAGATAVNGLERLADADQREVAACVASAISPP